jgi:hypothetical protein
MHRLDSSVEELNASPWIPYPTAPTEEDYPAIADLCLPCTSKDGAIQSGVTNLSEKPQSRVRNSDSHASPEIPSLQVQALSAAGKRDVTMMSP